MILLFFQDLRKLATRCSQTPPAPKRREMSVSPQKACCANPDNEKLQPKQSSERVFNAAINHFEMKHVNALCGELN